METTLPSPDYTMDEFYRNVLAAEIDAGELRLDSRILVVCGGETDFRVLTSLGFHNVTISNLDARMAPNTFAPFSWSFQDAENLSFEDDSFDFSIVHSGLHHCYSPHRAIGEMLRVSRIGIIGFEPYDSWITQVGQKFGLGQTYECAAVFDNACKFGGVANSAIPNFVYRFTEHELEKTFRCALPCGIPLTRYYKCLRINESRFEIIRSPITRHTGITLLRMIKKLNRFVGIFSNNIAFVACKPKRFHPWITNSGLDIDEGWFRERFSPR